MRTTLTIEDRLARELKDLAHRSGKPFKVILNETLRAGLAARKSSARPKPYRVRPASMGKVLGGIDLHKTLALADALEDLEILRELELRK